MENDIFPWNPHTNSTAKGPAVETVVPEQKSAKQLLSKLKIVVPYLFVALVITLLFLVTKKSSPTSNTNFEAATLEVFTPLFAIEKGEDVPLDALRLIPVKKSIFSKTQILNLMNPDNVSALQGKLIAKKSHFPNKVIFWNDLELKKPSKTKNRVQIIYSN